MILKNKLIKFLLIALTIICNAFVAFYFWASATSLSVGEHKAKIEVIDSAYPQKYNRTSLRVLTWNLAFAHGQGSEGVNYIPKTRLEHLDTLRKMGELIKELDVDIVLFQEIDWNSHRSQNIDQVEFLASRTGLVHAARALSWEVNYLPFPYLPIQHHFGRIKSGGAVISRIPLEENIVHLFEKPSSRPWWYKRVYLFRYSQAVSLKIKGKSFWILNQHLEAFDKISRQEQAKQVAKIVNVLVKKESQVLALGGDLNAIPPETRFDGQYHGDSREIYENDSTIDIFRSLSGFKDSISDEEYLLNEKHYYSYPSHDSDRRLDYLFVNDKFKVVSARVVTEAGALSDHLPYLIEIKL